jgi:hypothetical protein
MMTVGRHTLRDEGRGWPHARVTTSIEDSVHATHPLEGTTIDTSQTWGVGLL